jgi:ribonuclease P protein component
VGGAVVRNRVKRRVREWFRRERDGLEEGVDLVVIARPPAAELPGREVARELHELARSARLVRAQEGTQ